MFKQNVLPGVAARTENGRGLQLLLVTIAISAAVFAKTALSPLQETMRAALALTDTQMALLQGPALVFSMAIVAIPLGLLIDRYSRVRLLFILVVLLLLGSLLTAAASSYSVLFAARAIVGLGAISIQPVILSLIADLFPPEKRGRASMLTLVGQYLGWSAVFAMGGTLVTMFGSDVDAWRRALAWLTGPLLALVTLSMFALREPPRQERTIEDPSTRESFAELWRYRAMVATLLAGIFAELTALHAILTWAAPTLARGFALPPDRVGGIMAIFLPLGGIAGSLAGGSLADVCQRTGGPRRTISVVAAMALLIAPLGSFALMPTLLSASVTLVLAMTLLTAIAQMVTSLAIVVIPNELRGLFFGTTVVIGTVGIGSAPVLVSLLSEALGGPPMIGKSLALVCLIASLLCGTVYAFGRRHFAGVK